MAFYISVIPILNGDLCYFCFYTTSSNKAKCSTSREGIWRTSTVQTCMLFSIRSPCLHTFASHLRSIFSFIINLNENFWFKTGLCSLCAGNKFRENKGTWQAKSGMLDNKSAELLLVKTILNTLLNPWSRSSLQSEILFPQATDNRKTCLGNSSAAFLPLKGDELGEA